MVFPLRFPGLFDSLNQKDKAADPTKKETEIAIQNDKSKIMQMQTGQTQSVEEELWGSLMAHQFLLPCMTGGAC